MRKLDTRVAEYYVKNKPEILIEAINKNTSAIEELFKIKIGEKEIVITRVTDKPKEESPMHVASDWGMEMTDRTVKEFMEGIEPKKELESKIGISIISKTVKNLGLIKGDKETLLNLSTMILGIFKSNNISLSVLLGAIPAIKKIIGEHNERKRSRRVKARIKSLMTVDDHITHEIKREPDDSAEIRKIRFKQRIDAHIRDTSRVPFFKGWNKNTSEKWAGLKIEGGVWFAGKRLGVEYPSNAFIGFNWDGRYYQMIAFQDGSDKNWSQSVRIGAKKGQWTPGAKCTHFMGLQEGDGHRMLSRSRLMEV